MFNLLKAHPVLLTSFIALISSGCSTPQVTSTTPVNSDTALQSPLPSDHPGASTPLGAGDIFEIRVYGEKELTGVHRVDSKGNIDVPLVGRIPVHHLNRSQLVDLLQNRLSKFIKSPQVSVFIKERKS